MKYEFIQRTVSQFQLAGVKMWHWTPFHFGVPASAFLHLEKKRSLRQSVPINQMIYAFLLFWIWCRKGVAGTGVGGTERVLVIPSFYIVLPLGQMHYRKLFTLNNRPKHYPSPFRSHYSDKANEQTVIRQTGGLAPGLSRHTADQIVSVEAGG